MGFARAHQNNTPREKRGCDPGVGELTEIRDFPFIIYATAEASNLAHSLGLPRPIIESSPEENVGVALG